MLLGGVFQATGNASPVTVPAKGKYMLADMARFARRCGVPFRFNSHFPINTLVLMRGAFGAPTMFVGDEMFFGQDRLDFAREALAAA